MDAEQGWEPVKRVRAYEQVMAQIEERILDGRLKAGDRLPSERDLAISLGVSRPSLRESLRVLEALGVVEIRRGGGPDGGATLVESPGEGMSILLKLQIALAQFTWQDVLETRVTLERWCAREAALRSSPEDHRELALILDAMENPAIDSSEFNRLDASYHVRIAEATGNALTAHLMGSLRIAIHRQMVAMYARLDDWRATAVTVRREHREILEAIVSGEPDLAEQRINHHITDFYNINRRHEPLL